MMKVQPTVAGHSTAKARAHLEAARTLKLAGEIPPARQQLAKARAVLAAAAPAADQAEARRAISEALDAFEKTLAGP
jgi:hypothetical protein